MTDFNELEARIKLAEARGWRATIPTPSEILGEVPDLVWVKPDGGWQYEPPNPFKDANEDYAYLEWMREQPSDKWLIFCVYLKFQLQDRGEDLEYIATAYVVGDYARAALKVISDD